MGRDLENPQVGGRSVALTLIALDGGSVWESNPTEVRKRTPTRFEDAASHQASSAPQMLVLHRGTLRTYDRVRSGTPMRSSIALNRLCPRNDRNAGRTPSQATSAA